eukprot:gene11985-14663_t
MGCSAALPCNEQMKSLSVPSVMEICNGFITQPVWTSKPSWFLVKTTSCLDPCAIPATVRSRSFAMRTD